MKVVILLLASTGMRIGAIPALKIRNLKKVEEYGLSRLQSTKKLKNNILPFAHLNAPKLSIAIWSIAHDMMKPLLLIVH
jgi:hypothetical protein